MFPDPSNEDIRGRAPDIRASSFWLPVFAVWLVLLIVAGTLALALAIWNLIGAF